MTDSWVFASDRLFEAWLYTVSHQQLLIRSNRTDEYNTRIELLFESVSLMLIAPFLKGLHVSICDAPTVPELRGKLTGQTLYRLDANGFTGFVEAASLATHEDGLEYHEPSALLKPPFL